MEFRSSEYLGESGTHRIYYRFDPGPYRSIPPGAVLVAEFLSEFGPPWSLQAGVQQLILGYLRRSHHAFAAYHEARTKTLQYLEGNEPYNPKLSAYYDAVATWEGFALQASMALHLYKRINQGQGAFAKNDGSPEQRLYTMANHVKHLDSCVTSGQCTEDDTLPLWLSNDGLQSFGVTVSYDEAAGILADMATLADRLQDPVSLRAEAEADGPPSPSSSG